jgi:Asp-tRNA(Asn)/Glu-tRNA(Gln) amidotransferase A subunit family amidase
MDEESQNENRGDADLCYLSATESLRRFRERSLSPVELMEAVLRRIEATEPHVNAFSAVFAESAMQAARRAEKAYASSTGDGPRPLEGLPVVLKNEHKCIGHATDWGSVLMHGVPDDHNSPIAQRILDAGGIVHAKSNVPEFFCAMFTRTNLYGTTCNPWNPELSPGGSSGGSGAALAAGTAMLASGSDIAGSIRIPSSQSGVVGLKPSYGRVPEEEIMYAMNPYNHMGPMARTVPDCALLFDVINGPDIVDPFTLKPRLEVPRQFPDIEGMRIALSRDLGFFQVDEDVERNTVRAAEALESLGVAVEEVDLGWTEDTQSAAAANVGAMMGRLLWDAIKDDLDKVNDYVIEFAEAGMRVTMDDFLSALETQASMYQSLSMLFGHFDALICPTIAHVEIPAEGVVPQLPSLYQWTMAYPFNMTSRHPVLALPTGLTGCGVPSGLQIVGPAYEDFEVLRIGANLESVLPSLGRPPLVT